MTISKKLFLTVATLTTCVSSIALQATFNDSIETAASLTIAALGPNIILKNLVDLKIAEDLANITPGPKDLQKQVLTLQKRAHIGLVIGAVVSTSHILGVSLAAAKKTTPSSQEENNLPTAE